CNLLFVIKVQKLFDMTKPRLVKVRALFYGFQYITKQRGCANFDTAPCLGAGKTKKDVPKRTKKTYKPQK
ncbi:MAG: hypothetical protein MR881_01820, partial [Bacteroidales bacterium]|nr:hypothetical protein [Bacteroidales bacterium]